MKPLDQGLLFCNLHNRSKMELTDKQISDLTILQNQFFQPDFVNRFMHELNISQSDAESITQSAALADAYLSIKGREYKKLGYKTRLEFCTALLEFSSINFLSGFSRVANVERLYKKLRIYRERRGVNAFEAAKWLLYYNQNNSNGRKITNRELVFIDKFLRNYPLAGYKKVYTALKAEFGTVSVSKSAISYQIKKVISTFEMKE